MGKRLDDPQLCNPGVPVDRKVKATSENVWEAKARKESGARDASNSGRIGYKTRQGGVIPRSPRISLRGTHQQKFNIGRSKGGEGEKHHKVRGLLRGLQNRRHLKCEPSDQGE